MADWTFDVIVDPHCPSGKAYVVPQGIAPHLLGCDCPMDLPDQPKCTVTISLPDGKDPA